MDRPDSIQLLMAEHGIDAAHASRLKCPSGRVLVEMLPSAGRYGSIFLPDKVSADMRPDVGIVLSRGPDVSLEPGQMVAVRGYDGQWLEGFRVEDSGLRPQDTVESGRRVYETKNQVRVYGRYSPTVGSSQPSPWQCSIPLIVDHETEEMTATHNNLIVRRDAPLEIARSSTGVSPHPWPLSPDEPQGRGETVIHLPDICTYREGFAEILSIGPKADLALPEGRAKVGDRIHYDTRCELEFAFAGDPDLAIIPDLAVNFVI